MAAFAMLHPGDEGEETFVHCGDCGHYEPLGLGPWGDDDVLDEAIVLWEKAHVCAEINTTGMLLHSSDEEIAAAFGTTGIG